MVATFFEAQSDCKERATKTRMDTVDFGERGRNRTYNLLSERQVREINGFSDFRAFEIGGFGHV
jgi:hypothetical protein